MTVIYFIRKCASQDLGTAGVCDAADDTTPTLTRLVLSGTSLVQEDVVAGVEQLQATFGKLSDAAVPKIQYYAASAISATDWPSIVNVQVSLIVRGTEYDVTHTDNRSFKLYGGFRLHAGRRRPALRPQTVQLLGSDPQHHARISDETP